MNGQTQDMQVDPKLPVAKPWVMQSIDRFGNVFFSRNPYFWKVDTEGNQLPYIDKQARMLISDMEVVKLNVQARQARLSPTSSRSPTSRCCAPGEKAGGYTTMLYAADLGAIRKYQFNLTVTDPALRQIFNDIRFRAGDVARRQPRRDQQHDLFRARRSASVGRLLEVAVLRGMEADHFAAYDPAKADAILDEIGLKKGPAACACGSTASR